MAETEKVKRVVSADTEEITPLSHDRIVSARSGSGSYEKIAACYGQKVGDGQGLTPSADITYIMDRVAAMTEAEALAILRDTMAFHADDPNFPSETMAKIKQLTAGRAASGINDPGEYDLELRAEAALIHHHSPYPEVRSVTTPTDDLNMACETIRAYLLGLVFMAGATAINTFFAPRQPSISLSYEVLQLLLVPCGHFVARVLPAWKATIPWFGVELDLNPGPWTLKEQVLATLLFSAAKGPPSTYTVYLVQRMPQYLNKRWVTFGYEITLALATQTFGVAAAGLLRRFVVYPATALWPRVFPSLALNRALILSDKPGEVMHGWRVSRYRFFAGCAVLMFAWFWVPNSLFKALRLFNWMTWLAPQNFALGMITGGYGGMGFNPWSTFDWNVAGSGFLVTPFFSTVQQYGARVLSGLIIIGMYWGNMYWSAYMPINSNEAFANNGKVYNVTRILTKNGDSVDQDAYRKYGPPFFSGANVFGQGAWMAWYPMALFSVGIQHWDSLRRSVIEMWRGLPRLRQWFRRKEKESTPKPKPKPKPKPRSRSVCAGYNDAHSRMAQEYPEVPDWWFLAILILSLTLTFVALTVWPVNVPIWPVFAIIGISLVFLIPSAILAATANVGIGFGLLFETLCGIWMAGNPQALIILNVFGTAFDGESTTYASLQKMGHYAKIPPRAIFRAQMLALVFNCFVFIAVLDWMVDHYDDGTLCTWANSAHFVCTGAVLTYASATVYGAFGVRNMFALYPIMPWCFLIGSLVGITWGLGRRFGGRLKLGEMLARRGYSFHRSSGLRSFRLFEPAVFWHGALNWTGGNNLSYATNGMYVSFIFMYLIKRRYGSWWEKYNYLLEAGLDVGVAISGLLQTFVLDFAGRSLNWWGNWVATAGVDFAAYKQNATLLPLPEKGYFGPEPGEWPTRW